jgi:hypothetical protein
VPMVVSKARTMAASLADCSVVSKARTMAVL